MGVGVYGGKDFWKRYVFSLQWKSEGVMDDDSGDSEEDEGEEDWLRQGWRSEAGSLFQRWGKVQNGEEILPKVSTSWVRRINVTDHRQTTDRRICDSKDPNIT